ncbi:Der1-like family-domain-containing protein [Chytridium lagenaria]|nr:Der1-like family-domain-containing protein [Chytridium lagenaria]
MALLYVWAMENREQVVSFFFGLQFKAMYLPIVLIGFDVLTGAPFMDKAIGLAVGHLFYFLDKMYPQQNNGERILSTPAFSTGQRLGTAPAGGAGGYRAVPTANTRGATTGAAGAAGAGEGMRYRWGGGNRLGTD